MPYKDPEKQKEAQRKSAAKRREKERSEAPKQEAAPVEVGPEGYGTRPTVEDAEAVYGDFNREEVVSKRVTRQYGKSRTWACVMYQDSAPPDWEDKLRMIGVSFAVSPLHDKDITAAGVPKKAHWHVILDWPGGSTTYATAAGISRGVLKGTIPIPLVSPRGYYRYFTHLDNPNKAQYDSADIVRGGGFDPGDFLELTSTEKAEIRKKLLELIHALDIMEYWDLVMYTLYNEDAATHNYVCENTRFFATALSSRRNSYRDAQEAQNRAQGKPKG